MSKFFGEKKIKNKNPGAQFISNFTTSHQNQILINTHQPLDYKIKYYDGYTI
jgi:hypothetical protein